MSNKTVSKLKQKYATRNTNVQKIVRADARGVQTYQGQKSGPPLFGGPLQINFPRNEFLPQSGPASDKGKAASEIRRHAASLLRPL